MWSQRKEFCCDHTSTTDAGRPPDPPLFSDHDPAVSVRHQGVCQALRQTTRSARCRTHSSILKGVDDIIEALETKIALPFENREWAARLNLKPKRGVLLAGPPGTGKTTIGRALAHRLKGKFFLVDGTMIAGSDNFYRQIDRVFAAASRSAPSVIFIDDADVIFGGDKESGLYRYLLTKMDGLESASAGRVCVMMTAMEPADLPAAMLRSGCVELWLETRLPDA